MIKTTQILILTLLVVLSACQNPQNLKEQNKAIVSRYVDELINKGDFSKAEEIITSDFTVYANGEAMPVKGVELLKSIYNDWNEAISNGVLVEEETIADENIVAVRWYEEGVHNKGEYMGIQPQDKQYKYHGMSFYKIEGGLITEAHIVADIYSLMVQLGGLPS